MKNKKIYMLLITTSAFLSVQAQEMVQKDTIPSVKEVKNRNVMLNASEADNRPREISIGLPSNVATIIYEDALPVSYHIWPCLPYRSWKGGMSYKQISLMSLSETALRNGTVGYTVDSYSRQGTDKFMGLVDYTVNHFGKQVVDANLSGPIKKGWSYSIGTYQVFDPGSNKQRFADLQDRTQMYKAGFTKTWKRGQVSLFYKYTQQKNIADNNGPFYYNNDGSVTSLPGFDLGRDSYLPVDGRFEYMDIMSGEIVRTDLNNSCTDKIHDLNFLFDYTFDNGMKLAIRSKYKHGKSNLNNFVLTGIDDVTTADGYYAEDGTPYQGLLQNRYIMHYKGFEKDWLTNVELTRKSGRHAWRIGLNEFLNYSGVQSSTSNMAHEVKADPQRIYRKDRQAFWGFNTGAEYYDGHENKLALYASDDWDICSNLWLSVGARLEYFSIGGDAALNLNEQANNNRTENFNLKQDGVTITPFSKDWLNPSATVNLRYTILHGFGLLGEYVYNRQRPKLEDYAGSLDPNTSPVDVHMGRAGIFYNNSWLQLVSQVSYISQSNYKSRTTFTKQIASNSESITEAVNYDVSTIGWTTDAVFTPFKGFAFHGLFTWQSPKYKSFVINPKFSDGSKDTYDFSDKNVTGMSDIIVELDPSYTIGDWRIWASFRYQSKQYINKTNSLYFNGRWETFGGIDYRLNKHVAFSVSAINFLNQKGASGSIGSADLVEDGSGYKNYLMAGSYIRPMTFEFSAHINF